MAEYQVIIQILITEKLFHFVNLLFSLQQHLSYCELEQELQYELNHYEALHPGYDEYRFDLDEIEHDPYVLISILTAFHEGVFTIDEVQAELQMLFEKQYILTQTVEVEVRYRTETRTDSQGNDYDVEVPPTN